MNFKKLAVEVGKQALTVVAVVAIAKRIPTLGNLIGVSK